MAESIDHMGRSGESTANELPFAGACVIVPPAGGGETVEVLLLDEKADPAQFWATVMTRIQMRLKDLETVQQVAQGFGRR